jgi:pimeloyl-ACP methyl ester carboxylesterase
MMRPAGVEAAIEQAKGTTRAVRSPTGAVLHVEEFGSPTAPTLVFTHGWGADSREWRYASALADRFHVVAWDLAGLGASTGYPDRQWSLERMADDLHAVVTATAPDRVILIGHSVGGMINLEYTRRHRDMLGDRVAGVVQLNTTYTNPVRTTRNSERATRLQKPVLEPALAAAIALSPAVRAVGWLNYMNGLTHLHLHRSSFAGTETRGELDFVARYGYRSSPDVIGRGALAMLHWDASTALASISVPVLIVTAAQDRTTVPEASLVMNREIPGSRLVQVQPAAHMGPIERHEAYNASIADFANSVLSSARVAKNR